MENQISNAHIRFEYIKILKITPWFVTGFSDGEASFMLWVRRSDRVRTKWEVSGVFSIHLHRKDLALLQAIQAFFFLV